MAQVMDRTENEVILLIDMSEAGRIGEILAAHAEASDNNLIELGGVLMGMAYGSTSLSSIDIHDVGQTTHREVHMPSLNSIPIDFLHCRALGHQWEEFVPVGMRRPSFGFRFSLLCTRCGTEQHQLLDTNGHVQQRAYIWPDGYRLDMPTTRPEAKAVYNRRRRRRSLARRGHLTVVHDTA